MMFWHQHFFGTEKGTGKSAMIASETSLFNGRTPQTHTHSLATHRNLQRRFGREKLIKRFELQQKVEKYHKRYSSYHLLKETMQKQSKPASNTSSLNGCLCLTSLPPRHFPPFCIPPHKNGEGWKTISPKNASVGGYRLTCLKVTKLIIDRV